MMPPELETYSIDRFRFTLIRLAIIFLVLIALGLLIHRTNPVNRAVWKTAPYGEQRDTGTVRAGR
jgi:hypothetical protein